MKALFFVLLSFFGFHTSTPVATQATTTPVVIIATTTVSASATTTTPTVINPKVVKQVKTPTVTPLTQTNITTPAQTVVVTPVATETPEEIQRDIQIKMAVETEATIEANEAKTQAAINEQNQITAAQTSQTSMTSGFTDTQTSAQIQVNDLLQQAATLKQKAWNNAVGYITGGGTASVAQGNATAVLNKANQQIAQINVQITNLENGASLSTTAPVTLFMSLPTPPFSGFTCNVTNEMVICD